jgi:hypothetical protein
MKLPKAGKTPECVLAVFLLHIPSKAMDRLTPPNLCASLSNKRSHSGYFIYKGARTWHTLTTIGSAACPTEKVSKVWQPFGVAVLTVSVLYKKHLLDGALEYPSTLIRFIAKTGNEPLTLGVLN